MNGIRKSSTVKKTKSITTDIKVYKPLNYSYLNYNCQKLQTTSVNNYRKTTFTQQRNTFKKTETKRLDAELIQKGQHEIRVNMDSCITCNGE